VYMTRTQVSDDESNEARPNFQDWYKGAGLQPRTLDTLGGSNHLPRLVVLVAMGFETGAGWLAAAWACFAFSARAATSSSE
jgi:hypothetical protein